MSAAIPSCRVVAVALCAALAFGAPATPPRRRGGRRDRPDPRAVQGCSTVRRVIEVSGKMKLDERSAKRFWPIYQSYLMDIVVMRDRQLDSLGEYARQLDARSTDEPTARASLKRSLELEQAEAGCTGATLSQNGRVSDTEPARRIMFADEFALALVVPCRALQRGGALRFVTRGSLSGEHPRRPLRRAAWPWLARCLLRPRGRTADGRCLDRPAAHRPQARPRDAEPVGARVRAPAQTPD